MDKVGVLGVVDILSLRLVQSIWDCPIIFKSLSILLGKAIFKKVVLVLSILKFLVVLILKVHYHLIVLGRLATNVEVILIWFHDVVVLVLEQVLGVFVTSIIIIVIK